MSPQDFCYWLQGYLELAGANKVGPQQVQMIKDHLNLVFEKKTPNRTPSPWSGGGGTSYCSPNDARICSVNELEEELKGLQMVVSC